MWLVFSLTSLFVIAASANRLGQVNYMAIGKKAGQATRSLTTSGLAMVGIELLRLVQVGHVTTIEGTVTVKRAGGETVQLGSESPIYEKDLVKTGPEGAVTLVFADGSKLSLTSNSSLVLEERTEAGLPGGLLQGRTVRFVTGPSQTRSVLRGLDLAGADLTTTSLGRRSLRDADLRKANLSGVNLSSRDLRGAFLEGANLINAKLMGANLTNANLSKADLTGANLGNARLEHSDLRGAELVGANLATTRLFKTLFAGANLKNAKLDGADLRDANLKEAENLTQGQLDVACGNQNTELPMGLKIKDCPGFVPFKLETPHITAGVRG